MHVELNLDIVHTERTTYDVLQVMGDLGGVLEVLLVVFASLVRFPGERVLKAIVSNRLYYLNSTIREKVIMQEKSDNYSHKSPFTKNSQG